jgi:hypothetical protein
MPANRHRRRAAAARARRTQPGATGPRAAWQRIGLALAGLALIAVAAMIVLDLRGAHGMRSAAFAMIFGCLLLLAAFIPGRKRS